MDLRKSCGSAGEAVPSCSASAFTATDIWASGTPCEGSRRDANADWGATADKCHWANAMSALWWNMASVSATAVASTRSCAGDKADNSPGTRALGEGRPGARGERVGTKRRLWLITSSRDARYGAAASETFSTRSPNIGFSGATSASSCTASASTPCDCSASLAVIGDSTIAENVSSSPAGPWAATSTAPTSRPCAPTKAISSTGRM
mmetsp:Transcript_52148/g.158440  ORF Transcript_52148/g.158440 Transcript_52148/m.158440 type:complete len:207 (+) Transcript_52148:413-1033(+)